MIFVTGDTHADIDIGKLNSSHFPDGRFLTKNDYVIITGDFGLIWDVNQSTKRELYWLEWLSNKPWTTLFIDGNHENFDRIEKLNTKNMFGGTVGVVNDSIFHLKRGEIYDIEGIRFFAFGGAMSTDKEHRHIGISWWPQEIPSYTEMSYAIDNLTKFGNKVDVIITHTCPNRLIEPVIRASNINRDSKYLSFRKDDPVSKFLDEIDKKVEFQKWFFGHFHCDVDIDDTYFCMYYNIDRLI